MGFLWGIDLGGTKIEAVVLPEGEGTASICRIRIPTEADRGYEHIIGQIARLVEQVESHTGQSRPERIGIGTPGAADPATGLMKNCNTTSLNGRPLPTDLSKAIGVEAIVANDANCFALAEATLGAAAGAPVVFGVIMGTGVGGGLVVNGKVVGGAQGIAGEWGHNLLEPNGQPCYCGKRGCVETVLAGPFLERYYESLSGVRRHLREITERTDTDIHAAATLRRLYEKFGEGLSVVVNIVDPQVIVLGGGVGNIDGLYTHGRDELLRWIFNDHPRVDLRRPTLGDSAGVFGAAMLAKA
ncbi:ROK family protein [Fimbriimonas ginsengisoli]|uniref:ROK family protein n=1 Tax=Fimbriimonas ginsengisoli Gsoil 348 TaxID=661478 RepID=A0A068NKR7_FIMGI|nr:ROK family protein [Fimbriimonas ginsengisoli]AIE83390.1 ROK family protein [Fimbriimonas ginsengisoli Gsoil 348]